MPLLAVLMSCIPYLVAILIGEWRRHVNLTNEQLDGLACVKCGKEFGVNDVSVPVDMVNGWQVFACADCVE